MSDKLPKAILFDLDETIVEYPTTRESWHSILEEFQEELQGNEIAKMVDWLSAYTDWYWSDPDRNSRSRLDMATARAEIAAAALVEYAIADDGLSTRIGHMLNHRRNSGATLYEGALETIVALGRRGVKIALVTNGHSTVQREKIVRFELGDHFAHIQIESEFGFGKPDERVFRHVLKMLDVDAADAWMVGDNLEWDVRGPQRVGIYSIWFDPRLTGLPAETDILPDRIIHRLSELIE